MNKKLAKQVRWIARIWSIPVIAYALMMVVGYTINWIQTGIVDPHAIEGYPFIENLPPIFMFIAIAGLAVSWRFEKLGSLITLAFCLATLPLLFLHWPITQDLRYIIPYILLTIVVIPGILFLINSSSQRN